jgi:tRNA (guanine9-N1)-methyltransferase
MISTEEYIKITSGAMKVVIDCAFEKLMTDKEISSIGTQLCYCYHSNKSSKCPVNLIFSGVGPLVKDRLKLLQGDKWPVPTHEKEFYDLFDNKSIVYLTGDSPNTLEKFDESCIYIIGGLVDRNRHKSCTYNKALEHKINTAKLPIREHISLTSSAILTVVHVMEIMLKFREKPDWKEVLYSVIPKRKVKPEDE